MVTNNKAENDIVRNVRDSFSWATTNSMVSRRIYNELLLLQNNLKYLNRIMNIESRDEWYIRRVASDCYSLITKPFSSEKNKDFFEGITIIRNQIIEMIKVTIADTRAIHTLTFLDLVESNKVEIIIDYIEEILECLERI